MRYLAVDPGGKRLGLAVGDDLTGLAFPLRVLEYRGIERAARDIVAAAGEVGAERVVLGLPTRADGSRGPASRRSERLAEELRTLQVEVALQGEYLSTNEARRRSGAAGRAPDRPVDDIAAQVILEEYLAANVEATER